MTTPNLKAQLAQLVKLQRIDSEIYVLNQEKTQKPEALRGIEEAFQAKKQRLAEAEKAYLDAQKNKKDCELELASKEESVKKLQTQLYALKTNKEYQAMLQQIQDAKADSSVIEDKIIESMEKIDAAKQDVDKEKGRLGEEEKVFNQEKKKVQDRVKEIDDRLAQLDAHRRQIIPSIDKKVLSQYERILKNREGLAIASVQDTICKGCNMQVPHQVVNLIQMYDRLITCGVCNRILYIQESLGEIE